MMTKEETRALDDGLRTEDLPFLLSTWQAGQLIYAGGVVSLLQTAAGYGYTCKSAVPSSCRQWAARREAQQAAPLDPETAPRNRHKIGPLLLLLLLALALLLQVLLLLLIAARSRGYQRHGHVVGVDAAGDAAPGLGSGLGPTGEMKGRRLSSGGQADCQASCGIGLHERGYRHRQRMKMQGLCWPYNWEAASHHGGPTCYGTNHLSGLADYDLCFPLASSNPGFWVRPWSRDISVYSNWAQPLILVSCRPCSRMIQGY